MQKLKILKKKETKRVLEMLNKQWGFDKKLDYAFLESQKGRVYIANKEIFGFPLEKIRVNSIGMYFAETRKGIRLSIEGSQLVGPHATKNVIELTAQELKEWMRGEDLEKETDTEGFVLLRHGADFLGTGKAKEGKILNFIPKIRRILA